MLMSYLFGGNTGNVLNKVATADAEILSFLEAD